MMGEITDQIYAIMECSIWVQAKVWARAWARVLAWVWVWA